MRRLKTFFTRTLLLISVFLALLLLACWIAVARPIGPQTSKHLIPPTQSLSTNLETHVRVLSEEIEDRSWQHPEQLDKAAHYIRKEWEAMGLIVEDQPFEVEGQIYRNVITRLSSNQPSNSSDKQGKIIIGAHYDSAHSLPGADDNASGTAGLIELARILKTKPLTRDIELVAYTLEEPPNFATRTMGSFIHAQNEAQSGAEIDLMISLEMIGYFSDDADSQDFPLPILKLFYPNKGNFVGVVDRLSSRHATRVKRSMRKATDLPIHSINGPESLPGINFSDHRNYWYFGYDAVMVTDTSFYRNKTYHTEGDTADRLDYEKMAKVVNAVGYFVTR